jgi:hypothetical protein
LFDLQAIGVDLYDLWRPGSGLSPRKVLLLVGQLPTESAYSASVRGGAEFRPWTPPLYLMAAVVNLLAAANRQRAGKRGSKPLIKPPVVERPKPTKVLTVDEIMRRQRHASST